VTKFPLMIALSLAAAVLFASANVGIALEIDTTTPGYQAGFQSFKTAMLKDCLRHATTVNARTYCFQLDSAGLIQTGPESQSERNARIIAAPPNETSSPPTGKFWISPQ
jgi:hypothetical protein